MSNVVGVSTLVPVVVSLSSIIPDLVIHVSLSCHGHCISIYCFCFCCVVHCWHKFLFSALIRVDYRAYTCIRCSGHGVVFHWSSNSYYVYRIHNTCILFLMGIDATIWYILLAGYFYLPRKQYYIMSCYMHSATGACTVHVISSLRDQGKVILIMFMAMLIMHVIYQ